MLPPPSSFLPGPAAPPQPLRPVHPLLSSEGKRIPRPAGIVELLPDGSLLHADGRHFGVPQPGHSLPAPSAFAVPPPGHDAVLLPAPSWNQAAVQPSPIPVELSRLIDRFRLQRVSLNHLQKALTRQIHQASGSPSRALACLHAFDGLIDPATGLAVHPDRVSFNAAIAACRGGGGGAQAQAIIEMMLQRAFFPDRDNWCGAIAACGHDRQPQRALALFELLSTRGPAHGVPVDSKLFNVAVCSCGTSAADSLLEWGIRAGVLRPGLGQDIYGVLHLAPRNLFKDADPDSLPRQLSPALAASLVTYLARLGRIGSGTPIRIPRGQAEKVRNAVNVALVEAGVAAPPAHHARPAAASPEDGSSPVFFTSPSSPTSPGSPGGAAAAAGRAMFWSPGASPSAQPSTPEPEPVPTPRDLPDLPDLS